ncbi:MAG: flavodoxin family protein [Candidatus Omnitrophica bacterium]|nr:flavodoxin family protein [Candidatus Omnitrophota bacterium]
MMKVLAISGTPKKGGLTDLLLDRALEGAAAAGAETEKIVLNDLVFRPCIDCGGCDKAGICVLEDDLKPVYGKLQAADSIIMASPVFFGTLSAQLKMMIDRMQALWVLKYVLKKAPARKRKGAFLCVGGMDTAEYFESAKKIIKIVFAVLNIEYSGELFFRGANMSGKDARIRDEMLAKAYELGESLAKIA